MQELRHVIHYDTKHMYVTCMVLCAIGLHIAYVFAFDNKKVYPLYVLSYITF